MPRPGDIFVTATSSAVAEVIRLVTQSDVNHTGWMTRDGIVVEAQPGGAVRSDARRYPDATWIRLPLTDAQRAIFCAVGENFAAQKIPYNYLDIAALAAARGWDLIPESVRRRTPKWLRRLAIAAMRPVWDRVSRPDRAICSQLDDMGLQLAGFHLFDDRRPTGDVTPQDIQHRGMQLGQVVK